MATFLSATMNFNGFPIKLLPTLIPNHELLFSQKTPQTALLLIKRPKRPLNLNQPPRGYTNLIIQSTCNTRA